MRKSVLVVALALMFAVPSVVSAQERFVDKIYNSFTVVGSKIGKDVGSLEIEQRIGYNVFGDFSVYLPIVIAESLYNAPTTKNYDFQGKFGLGVAYRHFFNEVDGLKSALLVWRLWETMTSTIGREG